MIIIVVNGNLFSPSFDLNHILLTSTKLQRCLVGQG